MSGALLVLPLGAGYEGLQITANVYRERTIVQSTVLLEEEGEPGTYSQSTQPLVSGFYLVEYLSSVVGTQPPTLVGVASFLWDGAQFTVDLPFPFPTPEHHELYVLLGPREEGLSISANVYSASEALVATAPLVEFAPGAYSSKLPSGVPEGTYTVEYVHPEVGLVASGQLEWTGTYEVFFNMATVGRTIVLVGNTYPYPTEKNFLEQTKSGSIPFSKDYSFEVQKPGIRIDDGTLLNFYVPLATLPARELIPNLAWSIEGLFALQVDTRNPVTRVYTVASALQASGRVLNPIGACDYRSTNPRVTVVCIPGKAPTWMLSDKGSVYTVCVSVLLPTLPAGIEHVATARFVGVLQTC